MNKLSKLTALLLAIVLALGVPLGALAESAENSVQDTIDTLTEYLQVADTALYKTIMGFTKYSDYWEIGYLLEDEDVIAYIANNDLTRVKEIQDHLDEMFWAASAPYVGTVGPMLPAVDVSLSTAAAYSLRAIARADNTTTTGTSGVELNKSVVEKTKGTYTITLESYVTGTVTTTTTTTTKPIDVVLVLDLSNSMNQGFGSTSRLKALKTAVQNFITTIASAEYYNADTSDHRVAIVTFNDGANTVYGLTEVTAANATAMKTTVGNFGQSQGTEIEAGMQQALKLLTPDDSTTSTVEGSYAYSGKNTDRKKVVITFSDGIPAYAGDTGKFSAQIAAEAINYAEDIKDLDATIYTVAVHNSAAPGNEIDTTPSSEADRLNAIFHAISSNYKEATATYSGSNLTITLGSGENKNYYLSASTPDQLNSIFQDVLSNEQTSGTTIELGTETVVKDVVTPYFDLPDNLSGVKVYTVDCTGFTKDTTTGEEVPTWSSTRVEYTNADIKFGTTTSATTTTTNADGTTTTTTTYTTTNVTEAPDTDAVPKQNTVWVENFDYKANYVANADHDDPFGLLNTFYGRKLVIEFDITPVDGFLGGNDVETNLPGSGIYENSTAGTPDTTLEDFNNPPNVDVPLWRIQVEGKHQHLFLSNEADLNELLQSFSLVYQKLKEDGTVDTSVPPYEVNGIRNGYATLVFSLTAESKKAMRYVIEPGAVVGVWEYYDENGNKVSDADSIDVTPFLTEDAKYTISYNVIPISKTDGTTGVAATHGSLDVEVHVFKPTFTFQDTTEDYLSEETATDYYGTNNYRDYGDGANKVYRESWSHTYYEEITVTINVADDGTLSYMVVNADGSLNNSDDNWDMANGETINFSGYGETTGKTYNVKMTGMKPTVEFTYVPLQSEWITENKISAVECVDVHVTEVKLTSTNTHRKTILDNAGAVTGETTYTTETVYQEGSAVMGGATFTVTKDSVSTTNPVTETHITTKRIEQSCDCPYDAPTDGITNIHDNATSADAEPEFVVHIKNAFSELKIIKKGLSVGESAIFTVTGYVPNGTANGEQKTWTVVLTKASADAEPSVTITGLLVSSTATVEEAGNWSWRYQTTQYEPDTKSVEILPKTQPTATITITNTNKNNQWLDDEVAVQNNFSVNGPGTVID